MWQPHDQSMLALSAANHNAQSRRYRQSLEMYWLQGTFLVDAGHLVMLPETLSESCFSGVKALSDENLWLWYASAIGCSSEPSSAVHAADRCKPEIDHS